MEKNMESGKYHNGVRVQDLGFRRNGKENATFYNML